MSKLGVNKIGVEDKVRRAKGGSTAVIVIAIVVMAVASIKYFSFLDTQLFEERSSHIVEFTDKASENIDSIIEYSWQLLFSCEHIIKSEINLSEEELLNVLGSTSDFIDQNTSIVLAIDEKGKYFASDQAQGRWPQPELMSAKTKDMQLFVAEIPHKNDNSYFMFIKRLNTPIKLEAEDDAITHIILAVDIEVMRDKMEINGYGNQCYTYLVNEDGGRIYKYTYAKPFIEGYNVLRAFQDYTIVHGGTYEEFVAQLEQGESMALEFEFVDADGLKKNWFVANAPVSSENWQMLLFLPTEILGENSAILLNRTIWFLGTAFIAFSLLIVIIVITMMISQADKRLMNQKDEANKLLVTAADEANSANKAKSDFLSHMSHDIRTPINGIMGMTDIALKNVDNPEKILDCLKKISGSSQHLLGLVNDVLDMSRIESGKTKVNHESFNIRGCIENCISIIGGQLITRDVALLKDIGEMEHSYLIGDELHLRQVFINILGNSIKFTPDGEKIIFRAKELESTEDRARFRFELEDTGIGMKEEFLPHLFEAFAQEDDGTRTTYKGTGLGMAITKKFIDLMGGTVELESKLNVGTKFIIEIWFDIDKEADEKAENVNTLVNLKGMKILLVEDIELNLEIAQSILEEEGAVITAAMNGQEALDAFANAPEGTFDAILMDIMMPVMDGITATKAIRALERSDAAAIPIIAVTANAYDEDIRKTKEAGMNTHLSKPIDADVLLKTLSHYYPAAEKREVELKGLKVLLADDVELNLEIACTILEEGGAVVTTVENGQEALDAFAKNPPDTFDVILMDVHMPVMDGLTATKAIRAMERQDAGDILILAMTADVYEEDVQMTKEAGMNGHLVKPLNVDKMLWLLSDCKKNV